MWILTCSHSNTVDCSLLLYTLVPCRNMHHSTIMTTNADWVDHIQQKLIALCFGCCLLSYSLLLYLCTLASEVAHFMIQVTPNWHPFFIHAFAGAELCPSLLDNISLRILFHDIRNCTLFHIAGRNCHSTTGAAAANWVCSDIIYIQGVTGGKDQTSGGCSLC